jgi:hypothetical protein
VRSSLATAYGIPAATSRQQPLVHHRLALLLVTCHTRPLRLASPLACPARCRPPALCRATIDQRCGASLAPFGQGGSRQGHHPDQHPPQDRLPMLTLLAPCVCTGRQGGVTSSRTSPTVPTGRSRPDHPEPRAYLRPLPSDHLPPCRSLLTASKPHAASPI